MDDDTTHTPNVMIIVIWVSHFLVHIITPGSAPQKSLIFLDDVRTKKDPKDFSNRHTRKSVTHSLIFLAD